MPISGNKANQSSLCPEASVSRVGYWAVGGHLPCVSGSGYKPRHLAAAAGTG